MVGDLVQREGADEIVDIAVLKILPSGNKDDLSVPLPVADFGDSDQLQVGGQFVIAVESPGNLPAIGRTILRQKATDIFDQIIPTFAQKSLVCSFLNASKLK